MSIGKCLNDHCELFLCENIFDETNKAIQFKTLSAVVFNKQNKHYTILKRNLNKDRIEIDSLTYHITKKCNFINDFDKVYLLLLEIL